MSGADNSSCSVFIGNISHDTTEEQLKELFSQVGPVVSVTFVYDRETKKPKNYGFCLYNDHETAMSAVRNLNKQEINGRQLCVSEANNRNKSKNTPPQTETHQQDNSACKVFIGNIPHDATEEQLRDIFSQIGPIISLKFVYDSETKKSKNFAFCVYRDQATATKAVLSLNKHEVNGRFLRVNEVTKNGIENGLPSSTDSSVQGSPCEAEVVDPAKARERISNVVASLSPEKMFELMKEMKRLTEDHPDKAREMLIANPQFAYALLQIQVVMGVVEPQDAMSMLCTENNVEPVQSPPKEEIVKASQVDKRFDGNFERVPVNDSGFRNYDGYDRGGSDSRPPRSNFERSESGFRDDRGEYDSRRSRFSSNYDSGFREGSDSNFERNNSGFRDDRGEYDSRGSRFNSDFDSGFRERSDSNFERNNSGFRDDRREYDSRGSRFNSDSGFRERFDSRVPANFERSNSGFRDDRGEDGSRFRERSDSRAPRSYSNFERNNSGFTDDRGGSRDCDSRNSRFNSNFERSPRNSSGFRDVSDYGYYNQEEKVSSRGRAYRFDRARNDSRGFENREPRLRQQSQMQTRRRYQDLNNRR
uniref:RRM domain-containing protein n=1 Tax=Strigamia maritima TaxID=126957 RepID=T1J374_STRMM